MQPVLVKMQTRSDMEKIVRKTKIQSVELDGFRQTDDDARPSVGPISWACREVGQRRTRCRPKCRHGAISLIWM